MPVIQGQGQIGIDTNQIFMGLVDQLSGIAKNTGTKKQITAAKEEQKFHHSLSIGKAKDASTGLGKLEGSKGKEDKIQTREGFEKAEKYEVEKAKLKNQQLGESKKLYDGQEDKKSDFKASQKWELDHFEATHKGDKDIVAKRMKFIDQQAAARGKFEESLKKENIALYKKHKGEEAALHAKYYPKPKAVSVKASPKVASATTAKPE